MIQIPKIIEFDDVRADLKAEAAVLIKTALDLSQVSNTPRLIHMCGIPGAGKTTYATKWIAANHGFVWVQFDSVMEKLSGYAQDISNLGLVEAFRNWELPARAIGYHLFQSLVENQRNIFFDHSGTSKLHIDLIRAVKARGYIVEMHYIDCPPVEAARRVRDREKLIQRHTPEALIYDRHNILRELLPVYEKLVDRFVRINEQTVAQNSVLTDAVSVHTHPR